MHVRCEGLCLGSMLTHGNPAYKQVFAIGSSTLTTVCKTCRSIVRVTSRSDDRYCFIAPKESATQRLASLLARDLQAGDCYCLLGDVGAGKSVFRQAWQLDMQTSADASLFRSSLV